ncbi:MAG: 6-carboxytetrahydropterin synthase QueD [Dehalococcoidia bacterium]|nr:6-carboxytetrahydropterin synthase QueD [Dehalococcoidia bacterium]
MYQLFVEEHFDAAHYLPDYNGKCERMHGHRFKVVIRVEGESVGHDGMVYDFARMKQPLREILSQLDHTCLNEVAPFSQRTPSSENIAQWLYDELQPRFAESPVHLTHVEVWESPTTGVSYSP